MDTTISTILTHTPDPFSGLCIADMGIKAECSRTDKVLTVHLEADFPIGILEKTWLPLIQKNLEAAFPSHSVQISFDSRIKIHKTQLAGKHLKGVKNTIAIASGKGGVGKSTITVNLAVAMARMGAKVGILDADIYGPSIPLMLGKTEPVEILDDKYLPVSNHGVQAMSIAYLNPDNQALIWRGPMLAKSLIHMLDLTQWDDLDYLFIDLPPGTGDIQLSLVQKIPLTTAVVVTTPQQVATLDAQKALTLFEKTGIDVAGVIENMALHICSHCQHEEDIFGSGGARELCISNDCLLLGQLPLDIRIQKNADLGQPTATFDNLLSDKFSELAFLLSTLIGRQPLNYSNRFGDIHVENRSD